MSDPALPEDFKLKPEDKTQLVENDLLADRLLTTLKAFEGMGIDTKPVQDLLERGKRMSKTVLDNFG